MSNHRVLTTDEIDQWSDRESMDNLYRIAQSVMARQSKTAISVSGPNPEQKSFLVSEFPQSAPVPFQVDENDLELKQIIEYSKNPRNRMTIDEVGSDDL